MGRSNVRVQAAATLLPVRIVCLSAGIFTLLLLAAPAAGQLIPVRTVPVASGDQFRLMPSQSMGMGEVRYAVHDSLADGWTNPALGARSTPVFLGSPTFYGISQQGGGGRSFPVGGLFGGSEWFGGVSVALQQVENDPQTSWWGWGGWGPCCGGGTGGALSDRFGRNVFGSAYIGRGVGDGPWTVGIGLSAASIEAMDGVDLLYAGSDRIDQSGHITDIRVGVNREEGGDRLGAVLVHNRVSMTHDVTYTQWVFDDTLRYSVPEQLVVTNGDESRSWAGTVTWERELSAPGWRIGTSATVDHMSHPKIPDYSIQNIPRDPGTTWAFEAGFGISRADTNTTFGLDVALQPIWTDTWQEADTADVTASGGRLSVGDRSIENHFAFTNVMLRTGVAHRMDIVELQAGLDIRSYGYTMDQRNWVEVTNRSQDEAWVEWSPTFGAVVSLDALDIRYGARITNGTGRPGLAGGIGQVPLAETLAGDANFVVAPGAPLTLQDVRVITHQISVAIPVR